MEPNEEDLDLCLLTSTKVDPYEFAKDVVSSIYKAIKTSSSFLSFDDLCKEYFDDPIKREAIEEPLEITKEKAYEIITSEKLLLDWNHSLAEKIQVLFLLRIPPPFSMLEKIYSENIVFQLNDEKCINYWKNLHYEYGTLDESRQKDLRVPGQNFKIFLKFIAPGLMIGTQHGPIADKFIEIFSSSLTRNNVIDGLQIEEHLALNQKLTHYSQLQIEFPQRVFGNFEKIDKWINKPLPLQHPIENEYRKAIKRTLVKEKRDRNGKRNKNLL